MIRLILLLAGLAMLVPAVPAADKRELRESLRHRLELLATTGSIPASASILHAPGPMQSLYEQRDWEPLWFSDTAPIDTLLQIPAILDVASRHGLEPNHYHRATLSALLDSIADPERSGSTPVLVDIELLTTDALLSLAHHLANGRIDPVSIDPEWFIEREQPELQELVLRHARGELAGEKLLRTLLPDHDAYRHLVEHLALKREIPRNGEWIRIDSARPLIRPEQSDERIEKIRGRLSLLGDLPDAYAQASKPGIYDAELELAVRRFQHRHGLTTDGIIGPLTLEALNTSPSERIDQLRANLERWRWLPRSLGEEYILVNIAGFDMQVISHDKEVMRQRVVVGQPYRRTPVFTERMSYLVINPSWEVPHRLASQDQLPRIQANPDYLEEMGFAVLQGWGANEIRVDPKEVDWHSFSRRTFPYRLRQAPGPDNALGQVKFMFPNRHNVYLHDTPARGLFALADRALSSGCIRIEDPAGLARWLLTERSAILSPERLEATYESGRETTIRLDRNLPVHLLYWTAWVDEDNLVHFRRDIYQRDRRLIEALDAPPPATEPTHLTAIGVPVP